MALRDVGDGLEGWAISHLDFAGIGKRKETKINSLLSFAHTALGSFRHHWPCNSSQVLSNFKKKREKLGVVFEN